MAAVRADRLEPAIRGEREYEFAGVEVFDAEDDSRFLTRTLTAFGYRRDQLGADLRRRLLAWGIMHRYSNLTWRLRRLPERRRAVAIYGLLRSVTVTDYCLPSAWNVEAVLPLDQVREALARVAGRHTRGKIVLQIGP